MNREDLKVGAFFTTNGRDVWKLEGYFTDPSCTLKNLETGKQETFGMGGLTAESFRRINELGNDKEFPKERLLDR